MTLKSLRAKCAKINCRAYRRKGRWFINEYGTFPYWGYAEGERGCLTERAALRRALRVGALMEADNARIERIK